MSIPPKKTSTLDPTVEELCAYTEDLSVMSIPMMMNLADHTLDDIVYDVMKADFFQLLHKAQEFTTKAMELQETVKDLTAEADKMVKEAEKLWGVMDRMGVDYDLKYFGSLEVNR